MSYIPMCDTATMIREASDALRAGRSVLIVAHPGELAETLMDAVLESAQAQGIACRNLTPADPLAPWVEYRPFGPCAMTFRRTDSTCVLIHQSAQFERQGGHGSVSAETVTANNSSDGEVGT